MHRDTEHRAKQIQNKADTVGEQREEAKKYTVGEQREVAKGYKGGEQREEARDFYLDGAE